MFVFGDNGSVGVDIGDAITKSVRTRASASANMSRTFGAPTDGKKWTLSIWFKRAALGSAQTLYVGGSSSNDFSYIGFLSGDTLTVQQFDGGVQTLAFTTTAVFRDPGAYGHIVVQYDSTQATGTSRLSVWYNNSLQAGSYGAGPIAQNTLSRINTATTHYIGRYLSAANFVDGYFADVCFVDGSALTPSSFGRTSADTGAWVHKNPTGVTWGANGFRLQFLTGSVASDLGTDSSGNGNTFTVTNMSVTAGVTNDWLSDTPTNTFATLDLLNPSRSTLSNGNLTASGTTDLPTIRPASGTWYFEIGGVSKTWTPPAAFPAAAGDYNFGQRAFANTPTNPTLCTANLSGSGTVTVSGTFTGNASADGPNEWMNGTPTTLTINGNAVTFGTHADALAGGFKLRTSSASYNTAGSNTWTATIVSNIKNLFKYANARGN